MILFRIDEILCQIDDTVNTVLTVHAIDTNLILITTYSSLSITRRDPCDPSPWCSEPKLCIHHCLVWPKDQTFSKKIE